MAPVELSGIVSMSGASFLVAQTADAIYNLLGIDGSTCVEFTPDYPNLQIDVSDSDNITTAQRIYSWSCWAQTTSAGIALMFRSVLAQDTVNFTIDTAIVDAKLDNTKSTPIIIGGGSITRSDGSTVIAPTSNSIQLDPGRAFVVRATPGSGIRQTVWVPQ